MNKVKYYLAGKEIQPRNRQELAVKIDWENKQDLTASFTNLDLVNEDVNIITSHIRQGNIFEGIPLLMQADNFSINLVADTVDNLTINTCNTASVGIYQEQGRDWLEEVAEGITFRYLASKGAFTSADYVPVPYILNFVPDNQMLIITALTIYSITRDINDTVDKTSELAGQLKNALVPIITLGPTGPTAGPDTGAIVLLAVNTVAKIVYLVAMAIALKNLIEELLDQIFPPKRYVFGMKIKSLFEKGCNDLQLQFQSTLIDNLGDRVIVPALSQKGPLFPRPNAEVNALPKAGSAIDNFADFIGVMMQMFNADFRIKDGVLRFEQKEYWKQKSQYTIPSTFIDQDNLSNPYKYNSSEIVSNYNISYLFDSSDENTLDNKGRVFQAVTDVNTVKNRKHLKLKGLTQVTIPFALGTRKSDFTNIEKALKGLFNVVDVLAKLFRLPLPSTLITSRLGSLSLSNHSTTVPKILQLQGGKLAAQQDIKVGAESLWDNYHYTESFVPVNGASNQRVIYEGQDIPFCLADLDKVLASRFCNTADGRSAEIKSIEWLPEQEKATISYEVEQIYTNNLKLIKQ